MLLEFLSAFVICGVLGGILAFVVYGSKSLLWKGDPPDIVSRFRWPIGLAVAMGVIGLAHYFGLPELLITPLAGGAAYMVIDALKREDSRERTRRSLIRQIMNPTRAGVTKEVGAPHGWTSTWWNARTKTQRPEAPMAHDAVDVSKLAKQSDYCPRCAHYDWKVGTCDRLKIKVWWEDKKFQEKCAGRLLLPRDDQVQ